MNSYFSCTSPPVHTNAPHTHWVNWARGKSWRKEGGRRRKNEKRHPPYDYAAWPARVCRSGRRVFPSPPCPATLPSDWSSPHSHPAHMHTHTHTHTQMFSPCPGTYLDTLMVFHVSTISPSPCTHLYVFAFTPKQVKVHTNQTSPQNTHLAQVLVHTFIH